MAEDGAVSVGGEGIGRLSGFRFVADDRARHGRPEAPDGGRRAAARARAHAAGRALAADPDTCFTLETEPGRPVAIFWRDEVVARLGKGKSLLAPAITLHRSLDALTPGERETVSIRLRRWLSEGIARHLRPLKRIADAASDATTPPTLRALLAPLADAGGIVAREVVMTALTALDREQRRAATKLGVKIGALDLFAEPLFKPEPMRWRMALIAARAGEDARALPPPGAVVLEPGAVRRRRLIAYWARRCCASTWSSGSHGRRMTRARGGGPSRPIRRSPPSLGLKPGSVEKLMRTLGFHSVAGAGGWTWRGRKARSAPSPGPAQRRLRRIGRADLAADG